MSAQIGGTAPIAALTGGDRSGLDLLSFGLAGFSIGRSPPVIGFFDFVMRFGHGIGPFA